MAWRGGTTTAEEMDGVGLSASSDSSSLPRWMQGLPSDAQLDFMAGKYGVDRMEASAAEANRVNMQLAEENRKFNAEQAQINRDWQERMSNTAHQREMRDLIAAGLNPILTATGGNGAAVGSGATATGTAAQVSPTITTNPFTGIASTALNARKLEQERKRLGLSERAQALNEKRYEEIEKQKIMIDLALSKSQLGVNSAVAAGHYASAQQALAGAAYATAQKHAVENQQYVFDNTVGKYGPAFFEALDGGVKGGMSAIDDIFQKMGRGRPFGTTHSGFHNPHNGKGGRR